MSALDALFGFGQSWQDVLSVGKLEVKHMLVLLTLFASEHPITKEHIACRNRTTPLDVIQLFVEPASRVDTKQNTMIREYLYCPNSFNVACKASVLI